VELEGPAQEHESVHAGHADVGEDEVVVARRELAAPILPVRDRPHLVAAVGQDDGEQVPHRLFVVDDEDVVEGHGAGS
jgi:hypothetical protein